jgi:hypothetical protein
VFVADPASCRHTCVPASEPGPNGEAWCWWQCTVKGGREARDIDAVAVAKAVEALGAGEIMLNCINNDGKGEVRRRRGAVGWGVGGAQGGARGVLPCMLGSRARVGKPDAPQARTWTKRDPSQPPTPPPPGL